MKKINGLLFALTGLMSLNAFALSLRDLSAGSLGKGTKLQIEIKKELLEKIKSNRKPETKDSITFILHNGEVFFGDLVFDVLANQKLNPKRPSCRVTLPLDAALGNVKSQYYDYLLMDAELDRNAAVYTGGASISGTYDGQAFRLPLSSMAFNLKMKGTDTKGQIYCEKASAGDFTYGEVLEGMEYNLKVAHLKMVTVEVSEKEKTKENVKLIDLL